MGTRNVTMVKVNGEYRISKYGQWDGYPSGRGIRILKFLRNYDIGEFREKVLAVEIATEDFIKSEFERLGSDEFWTKYPFLSRDEGGERFFSLLMEGKVPFTRNDLDFVADSLMCEFAWIIDLDNGTFECFKGFNHEPLTETDRFFDWMSKADPKVFNHGDGTTYRYYPCKLVASWKLDNLPSDEDFLQACGPKEVEAN